MAVHANHGLLLALNMIHLVQATVTISSDSVDFEGVSSAAAKMLFNNTGPPPHHQHLQSASFQLPTQQQQQQLPPLLYKQYLQKQQPAMQKAAPAPQGHTPLRGAAPQYWGGPQFPQYSQDQSFGFGAPDMGQDEDDRTSSPQSEGEMDVNQFLNIPIKTETREAKGS